MGTREPKIEMLKQYFQFAIGVFLSIAFSILKFPKLLEILEFNKIEGILSIILFSISVGYLAGWIFANFQEIQYIGDYLDTKNIRLRSNVFLSALFIGASAGLLIGFADQPRFHLMIFLLLTISGFLGNRIIRKMLKKYFLYEPIYQSGVRKIICDYYMTKRQDILDFTTIFVCIVGLGFSWWTYFSNNQFYIIGYIIAIGNVFVHESIIWYWRIKRSNKIDEIEE